MQVLGLDISTSCTGWCVINTDDHLGSSNVDLGYIPMSNIKGSYAKAQKVLETFCDIKKKYNITHIFVEENLQSFRTGLSSAKTLATLARFNGIVSYLSQSVFEVEPIFLNVNNARKSVGLKIIRKSKGGKDTKLQVFDWVQSQLEYDWPKKTLKSGPRKGVTILDPVGYDMADAYVITRSGLMNI